ncbi:hypothetical protein BHYA_0351g00070 [Botrytis hyacinthi]|uniref:Uncharacterized protein n=1 Tax=Botrytis hyacinthi TaxID=278943 RepID=A0A4Z1G531_9HELO|nr:hypothetical protein BHYA_0351g00070 [Botrytis hyacinthi]
MSTKTVQLTDSSGISRDYHYALSVKDSTMERRSTTALIYTRDEQYRQTMQFKRRPRGLVGDGVD